MNPRTRALLMVVLAIAAVLLGAAALLVGVFMVGGLGWFLIVAGAAVVAVGLLGVQT